ncbi:hypothetical protein ABPG74_018956 [Tetrahymena malaccensis]
MNQKTMENQIILQASKSIEDIKQELQNNSQRASISIQIQNIRQRSKQILDLLASHLKNQQHYEDVSIKIIKNTQIGDGGFQTLSLCLNILTKVQILKLFLGESCQVGSQGLIYLSQAISNLKQLSALKIIIDDLNYVRNEGLVSLANIFSQLPSLVKLQFKIGQSNRYDDPGISAVCQNLKLIKKLQHLKFEIDGNKISKVGVQVIAESLEQLTNLESLDFAIEARLGKIEGAKDLVISLGKLVNLKDLKFSIFQENRMSSEISIELCNSLKNLQRLESFLIQGFQQFQDEQTTACFAEIFNQKQQLKNLSLEINCPKLQGVNTIICLANTLKSLTNLTDFKICIPYDCNIGDQGCSALAQAVKNMINLKNLVLFIDGNNKVGFEGAFSIGDALGELKYLESIKLNIGYQNEISSEGARAIAEGIQKLPNIINLDVRISRSNNSKQIETTSFGQILPQFKQLEVLKYSFYSNISNLGASVFAQGFRSLKQIKVIQFNFLTANNFTEESQIIFFESFKHLTNLNYLKLQFSGFFDNNKLNVLHLSQSLSFLENLTELHLDLHVEYNNNNNNNQSFIQFGQALGSLTKIVVLELNITESTIHQFQQFLKFQQQLFYQSLAQGIKNLVQIQDLKIVTLQKQFNQSQIFQEILKSLINLKKLRLFVSSFEAVNQIGNSLQYLQNLEYLYLDCNLNDNSYEKHDQEIVSLGKGLCYLTNLNEISLNIYFPQKICDQTVNQIVSGIKSIKNLQKIDTTINSLNSQQIDILDCIDSFESIQSVDFNLGKYTIFDDNNYVSHNQQETIQNQIQDKIQLQNQQNENNLSLTQLSITMYKINVQKTDKLDNFVRSISNYKNINKFSFYIKDNKLFTIEQFQLMCASLSNLSYLQELTLNLIENNQIGPQSAKYLASAFKRLPELEQLNLELGNQNYINEEGAHHLAQGMKSLINLRKLIFQLRGCNIQKQGAIQIGDCLQHLTKLRILLLEIGNDKIEKEGAISIGKSIKHLSNLTQLKIYIGESNQIQKEGACAIGDGMQYLTDLTSLDLAIKDSNDIKSSGVLAICKSLSKMSYLKSLNMEFGDNNQIQSSSIQEISHAIKLLDNIQNFKIIVNVYEFTQNYSYEAVDMIKLIDPVNIIFKYDEYVNKIHNIIESKNKLFFQSNHFNIIANNQDSQLVFNNIFMPIESINQIPSIKQLQIKIGPNINIGEEGCSKLADHLKFLLTLEDLIINFNCNQIGSGILKFGQNLSQLTNLKHLSLGLYRYNNITGQSIQLLGKYLSQLHNLESFQFQLHKQNDLAPNDLLHLMKCISSLQKLKVVKIQQDLNTNKIFQNSLLNSIARKIRRLVVCKVGFNYFFDLF